MASRAIFDFIDLDGTVIKSGKTFGVYDRTYDVIFSSNDISFYYGGTLSPSNMVSFNGEGITGYLWNGTYHPVGSSFSWRDNMGVRITVTAVKYVTDLTDTTWYVPSGWTATAGYGKFSIDGEINFESDSWTVIYGIFAIGYGSEMGMSYDAMSNSVAWGENVFPHNALTNANKFGIKFTDGTDTTNPSLIQWLEANGELQAEEEAPTETVEITYNGEVIATLTAGQKVTLKCAGMKMLSDVVAKVSASEEVEDELAGTWVFGDGLSGNIDSTVNFTSNNDQWTRMSYDGTYLNYYNATWPYGYSVYEEFWRGDQTINITSKLSEVTNGDVLLTWLKANGKKQGEVARILFTIEGTTYQAEDGMTWSEWLESDYNTDNYTHLLISGVETVLIRSETSLYHYGLSYNDSFVPISDTIVADRAYVEKFGSHGGGSN